MQQRKSGNADLQVWAIGGGGAGLSEGAGAGTNKLDAVKSPGKQDTSS